jgi:hypothetical protein
MGYAPPVVKKRADPCLVETYVAWPLYQFQNVIASNALRLIQSSEPMTGARRSMLRAIWKSRGLLWLKYDRSSTSHKEKIGASSLSTRLLSNKDEEGKGYKKLHVDQHSLNCLSSTMSNF